MRVFTAQSCLGHNQGGDHPESPARLAAVLGALAAGGIDVTEATPASMEALVAWHPQDYLERAELLSRAGGGQLGPDTVLSAASWQATVGASGASLAALDHALEGGMTAFAAIRPPGHHALRDRAMGFCVVNHVAVLAWTARGRGRERVLIVDWDVHHGNGTQAMVERDRRTRFVSMHQWPWYPGTGAADERGLANCFNLPMAAGLPRSVYVETLWRGVERATTGWTPDVILLSAGYDAMAGDPLGGFTLESDDYVTWINRLRERFPDVPIVALMEGGYAPNRLAEGVVATILAMA
jgi:acetoin utilization deacetylase AcuC-like enzyme